MKDLTKRQKEVLSFIAEHINSHSYPPTFREIADHFAISVKGAHDHVVALKRKKYLKQDSNRSRTIELVRQWDGYSDGVLAEIPVVGTVAAGVPILSEENREGTLTLHRSLLKKNGVYFAVKVRGDSMSGAGIMDGDIAVIEKQDIVRNGEIVVAVIDDAVTLKRFYRENSRIRLQAENPAYKPIYCQDVRIVGRLSRIIRYY
jgi:repressor LexA